MLRPKFCKKTDPCKIVSFSTAFQFRQLILKVYGKIYYMPTFCSLISNVQTFTTLYCFNALYFLISLYLKIFQNIYLTGSDINYYSIFDLLIKVIAISINHLSLYCHNPKPFLFISYRNQCVKYTRHYCMLNQHDID